jgi:hypothetical protein
MRPNAAFAGAIDRTLSTVNAALPRFADNDAVAAITAPFPGNEMNPLPVHAARPVRAAPPLDLADALAGASGISTRESRTTRPRPHSVAAGFTARRAFPISIRAESGDPQSAGSGAERNIGRLPWPSPSPLIKQAY